MAHKYSTAWLDAAALMQTLDETRYPDKKFIDDILDKAAEKKGLTFREMAALMSLDEPEALARMFALAKRVKEEIYGRRIVLFAPMYVSNLCKNECSYCGFRAANNEVVRRALTPSEIMCETQILVNQGHKRVLLVSGEAYPQPQGLGYIIDAIHTIYGTQGTKPGADIRRVNVNLAPLSVSDFARLEEAEIGTFQIFQETYNQAVYETVHIKGTKSNFDWRVTAMDRAMEACIGDVGMGVLYGLADWRFDTLALVSHVRHLEDTFGVGAHTLSVPRLEPAAGSTLASNPRHPVSDDDFKKIVAILRLAVPYTGIIMSTRETEEMRRETLELGVSQISAGSRTDPGGYAAAESQKDHAASQFELGDHRDMDSVVRALMQDGFVPSNCTACDELGRMGDKFMPLARSGAIKTHCAPNALSTLAEYLEDYASPETKRVGEVLIQTELSKLPERNRATAMRLIQKVREGQRACLC